MLVRLATQKRRMALQSPGIVRESAERGILPLISVEYGSFLGGHNKWI